VWTGAPRKSELKFGDRSLDFWRLGSRDRSISAGVERGDQRGAMKLAFSTLGCPGWDLDTILNKGKEYGFDAVDFRGLQDEMVVPRAEAFSARLNETLKKFQGSGLQISCLSSSVQCVPRDKESLKASMDELQLYLELASKVGSPYVRIFGGKGPEGSSREQRLDMGSKVLHGMAELAGRRSVQLLLETHDDWCSSKDVKALLAATDHPCVGVCWDLHHPHKFGETPRETWSNLFPNVWYVHVKDAKIGGNGEEKLCLVGEGDLPLKEFLLVLKEGRYPGIYCLEWEKRWHPQIEEPEEAFPRYVERMKTWSQEIGK